MVQVMDNNSMFDRKLYFLTKILNLWKQKLLPTFNLVIKISIFYQNSDILPKFRFFTKIPIFFTKIPIFYQYSDFDQNSDFPIIRLTWKWSSSEALCRFTVIIKGTLLIGSASGRCRCWNRFEWNLPNYLNLNYIFSNY